MSIRWSADELAEMRRVDSELEAAPLTPDEWKETVYRDKLAARKTDKLAEYHRAYREANKDKLAERQRAYYEANKDKVAERQRAYREANKEAKQK